MPSLISTTERAVLTGIFNDIFDTFQRTIVVYKESLKTPVGNGLNDGLFGFGESQTQDAFTYSEVTGVFPAVVRYLSVEQPMTLNPEIVTYIPGGEVTIKVRKDCREYINNGKTEKILIDERVFLLDGEERKQTFLDSEFWVFKLKTSK
jgi:hypothetical protein